MNKHFLKPSEGSRETLIDALDHLLANHTWYEQLDIIRVFKKELQHSYEQPQNMAIHVMGDFWMFEFSPTHNSPIDLYFGQGYTKGVLTGEKPLTEWNPDNVLKDVSRATIEKFYDQAFHKDSIYSQDILIDLMYHFNNGEPWGSFSAKSFPIVPDFKEHYSLHYVDEEGIKTFLRKGTFAEVGELWQIIERVNPKANIVVIAVEKDTPPAKPTLRQESPDLPF